MHITSLIADVSTDTTVADGTSTGTIIAIVAAVAVVLIAVGLFLRRKKANRSDS